MENGMDQVPGDEVSSWGVPSFAERAQDIERQLKCELPWSELLVCIHWSDSNMRPHPVSVSVGRTNRKAVR
jgi:hypothetical protein